jgi:S1-C subfamily serine protease
VNETPEHRGSGLPAGCGCLLIVGALALLVAVLTGQPLLQESAREVPPPPPQGTAVSPTASPARPSGRRPGVVNIDTEQGLRSTRAAGTGILLDASGLVLTNNHVIQGATTIRGTVADTGRRFSAEVLGYDTSGDIAVIRLVNAARLTPAAFGDSSSVRIGEPVTAMGNAGGDGGKPRLVTGKVTALDQIVTATDESDGSTERLSGMIETDAPIRPGDSGGPLLNSAGQVIGINTAASANYRMEDGDHRGYAIPSNRAMEVARQIQRGQRSETVHIGKTPILGVQVRGVPSPAPGEPAPPATTGALIAGLLPGTPAEAAGLPEGGIIVSVNNQPVDSPATLTSLLLRHQPGETVAVGWISPSGERITTNIQLAEGPPQ